MLHRLTPRRALAGAAIVSVLAIACRDDGPLAPRRRPASVSYCAPAADQRPEDAPPMIPRALALVAGCARPGAGAAPSLDLSSGDYQVSTLPSLGGSETAAYAVNDSGWVVGESVDPATAYRAFLWKGGQIQNLGVLAGKINSVAYGINDAGDVVGASQDWNHYTMRATLWRGGQIVDLGTLPGFPSSVAMDVNNRGEIVGYVLDTLWNHRAVKFVPGGSPVDLGLAPDGWGAVAYAVNDSGVVTGSYREQLAGYYWRPARKAPGQPWEVLGGIAGAEDGEGEDINAAGRVAGVSTVNLGTGYADRAIDDSAGVTRNLGLLAGAEHAYATGIADDGLVVGYTKYADGWPQATLFKAGEAPVAIGDRYGSRADAISASGRWIVGTRYTASGSEATRWEHAAAGPPVPAAVPDSVPAWVKADSGYARDVPGFGGALVSRSVVWVYFRTNATQQERQAAVDAVAGEVVGGARWDEVGTVGRYFIKIPTGAGVPGVREALATLRQHSAVHLSGALIGGNVELSSLAPNDGAGWERSQWARERRFASSTQRRALELIDAPLAWGCETGDSSVAVALVDGGIYRNLDDGNWNINESGPIGFRSYNVPTLALSDVQRADSTVAHGTMVASMLAARGNNDQGMTGVMWRANVRMESSSITWQGGQTIAYNADTVVLRRWGQENWDGVARLIRGGARVINLSLGWWYGADTSNVAFTVAQLDTLWRLADTASTSRRPLFVLAAGNKAANAETDIYVQLSRLPYFADRFLIVAASNSAGNALATFSNYGPDVDVVAPGVGVAGMNAHNVVRTGNGTSYSAPLVSGVVGLLFSFDPTMTSEQAREYVLASAQDSIAVQGAGKRPFLNAYGALRRAAQRQGAPLCGNKVWSTPDGAVWVERVPDQIGGAGDERVHVDTAVRLWGPYVFHGGRHIGGIWDGGSSGNAMIRYSASTRTWSQVLPYSETGLLMGGTDRSGAGMPATHGFDTTFSVSAPPRSPGIAVSAQGGPSTGFAYIGTVATVPRPGSAGAYYKDCLSQSADYSVAMDTTAEPDTAIVTGFNGYNVCTREDSVDVAASYDLSPRVAVSPTGKFVIVAANLQSARLETDTLWSAWQSCSLDTDTLLGQWVERCRSYTFRRRSAGTRLYRVSLESGNVGAILEEALLNDGLELFRFAIAEDGETLVMDRAASTKYYGMPRNQVLPPTQVVNCGAYFYRWPVGGSLVEERVVPGTSGCGGNARSATISPRPGLRIEN
jgi:probable HAF family extracellular repeat protein